MSDEISQKQDIGLGGKIFTDKKIWLGSWLGGPLIAGYIIYKNYKIFGENEKANIVIIITIFFSIFLAFGIFMIPDNINIPSQLIPIIYTSIAWGLMKHFQGNKIEEHINNGGQLVGWGKTILISILGLVIFIIPLFIVGMVIL